jgi:hypothetical protein
MHSYFTNYDSSYMFRHCRIILRELVINTLRSYKSISKYYRIKKIQVHVLK